MHAVDDVSIWALHDLQKSLSEMKKGTVIGKAMLMSDFFRFFQNVNFFQKVVQDCSF
uniref:Uncharacterized protein n=1 Tax=Arundo donax TaxID=35708 RepID=A0A0A9H7X6_ARUDO